MPLSVVHSREHTGAGSCRHSWGMFFNILFFYSFLHLILIIIFSSRRLALLLLVKPWRSRLILRGLRLIEPVILSMLRLFEESLQLVLLSVIFLFWIDPYTAGLLLFRLLLSSTSISIRRSLLSFYHRKLLMWAWSSVVSVQTKHSMLMLVKLQCRFPGHRQSTYMDLPHHKDYSPCRLLTVGG